MKKQGFMLFETLVVSTVILGILIFLFVQFSAIKRNYITSFNYNTIPGLYNAKTFATFLEDDGYVIYDFKLSNETVNGYVKISCTDLKSTICNELVSYMDAKNILFVGNNISTLKNNLSTSNYDRSLFSEKFRQFILTLNTVEIAGKNRLIIEYNNGTYAVINVGISKDESKKVDYTVNHYQMNVDGSAYTLKESETFQWLSGYKVAPDVESYSGFTSPEKQEVIVGENTIINYYYERNKYTLDVRAGSNTSSVTGTDEYYYGQNVKVTVTPKTGYTFNNWTGNMTISNGTESGDVKIFNFNMPAKNVTITAVCK